MPFDSVGVVEDRRSIWGRGEGATNRRPSRFPNEIAKTAPTCPECCMRFYLTKRVERQSDITHGLFLFYLELYILNSAVI